MKLSRFNIFWLNTNWNYEKVRNKENPIYLPINLCAYCKQENYAFWIQCKNCWARVDFN